ncbi:MAG: hypothetical protein E6J42_04115 [Chloroflexi bacterium]|nr:MAG: hypothetical protein E6J42_04115 [Chloroflexota bacterium]
MARMIRKQIYIAPEQEKLLKQRSKESGLSEAALIREYIAEGVHRRCAAERKKAWEEALAFMEERAKMKVPQTGRTWTRDELYEERFERYSR